MKLKAKWPSIKEKGYAIHGALLWLKNPFKGNDLMEVYKCNCELLQQDRTVKSREPFKYRIKYQWNSSNYFEHTYTF